MLNYWHEFQGFSFQLHTVAYFSVLWPWVIACSCLCSRHVWNKQQQKHVWETFWISRVQSVICKCLLGNKNKGLSQNLATEGLPQHMTTVSRKSFQGTGINLKQHSFHFPNRPKRTISRPADAFSGNSFQGYFVRTLRLVPLGSCIFLPIPLT